MATPVELSKEQTQDLLSIYNAINKSIRDSGSSLLAGAMVTKSLESLNKKILKHTEAKSAADTLLNQVQKKIRDKQQEINDLTEAWAAGSLTAEADLAKAIEKVSKLLLAQYKIQTDLANQEKIKKGWEELDAKLGGFVAKGKKMKEAFNLSPQLFITGIAVNILLYTFKKIWGVFDQLDSAAADFRKSMGIVRSQSEDIEKIARSIAIQYMGIGVSAKDVYESFKAIAETAGSMSSYTEDMVKDMSLFSAQFGITAQTSAKFLKTMATVSKSTMSIQKDMLMVAQRMAAAAGVPLDDVLQDVAAAAEKGYQFLSRDPLVLLKSAVQAKLLGTSLQSSTTSAASLLNFTESVKNEMEASVLLGKSMNLQKARELAYHRDIQGLNEEIVKLAKEANFEQLDPFQQDAVAKALGKQAGEVASMLESDREHSKVLRAMTAEQRNQYNTLMNVNKSQIKDYAEMARKEIQTKSNQKAILAITQAWTAIFAKLGESVLPVIETVLTTIAEILNSGKTTIIAWLVGLTAIAAIVGVIGMKVMNSKGFSTITKFLSKGMGGGGGAISKSLKSLAGGLKALAKVPVQGIAKVALAIFLLGVSMIPFAAAMMMVSKVPVGVILAMSAAIIALGVAGAILGAFAPLTITGALAIGILGIAMMGFAAAAWIASKALQNLSDVPLLKIAGGLTVLGLASTFIVAGGIALGLAAPGIVAFSIALRLLAGPAERVGKAMMDLGTGLKSTVEALAQLQNLSFVGTVLQIRNLSAAVVELSKAINEMPDIKVEKLKSLVLPQAGGAAAGGSNSDTGGILAAIKDGIDGLRSDMKNGSLTANVYIDSQKLDQAMGRRLAYTGTLSS